MTTRRDFLLGMGGILASAAAPAIVRADSLMRVVPLDTGVFTIGVDFAGLSDSTVILIETIKRVRRKVDEATGMGGMREVVLREVRTVEGRLLARGIDVNNYATIRLPARYRR